MCRIIPFPSNAKGPLKCPNPVCDNMVGFVHGILVGEKFRQAEDGELTDHELIPEGVDTIPDEFTHPRPATAVFCLECGAKVAEVLPEGRYNG